MAAALRTLPCRMLRRLQHSNLLSTSASPPDLYELLCIQRILPNPTATTPALQRQQDPQAAAAATTTSLHCLLHRTTGLTAAEATSLLRGPNTHRLGRLLEELHRLRLPEHEIKNALESHPDGLLSMEPGEPSRLVELLDELRCRR